MSGAPQKIATPVMLDAKVCQKIDHWLTKFPEDQKRSAVIPALMIVQKSNGGWLSESHIEAVAAYLGLPRIAVYEVATFYTLFDLKPVGKHKLFLCTNVSCMLCGSSKIAEHLKQRLNVDFGETTHDGLFTLKEVECLGACGGAPAMQVDETYHENLTPEKIDIILKQLGRKS